MFDPDMLLLIAATFLIGGAAKGIVGFGLPTIAIAILAAAAGLSEAMAIFLVPSLATNLWQALSGGHLRETLQRTWPFLLAVLLSVWLGALVLDRTDERWLAGLLGVILIVYALYGLGGAALSIAPAAARRVGPIAGLVNGVITGMTGTFVVPGVIYLQALGLSRDALIQAMGMLFTVSTLALAASLGGLGRLPVDLALLSGLAVIPALAGMVIGRAIRRRLPEAAFRKAFFSALMALGVYILASVTVF